MSNTATYLAAGGAIVAGHLLLGQRAKAKSDSLPRSERVQHIIATGAISPAGVATVPPAWALEDFSSLARFHRVTLEDAYGTQPRLFCNSVACLPMLGFTIPKEPTAATKAVAEAWVAMWKDASEGLLGRVPTSTGLFPGDLPTYTYRPLDSIDSSDVSEGVYSAQLLAQAYDAHVAELERHIETMSGLTGTATIDGRYVSADKVWAHVHALATYLDSATWRHEGGAADAKDELVRDLADPASYFQAAADGVGTVARFVGSAVGAWVVLGLGAFALYKVVTP